MAIIDIEGQTKAVTNDEIVQAANFMLEFLVGKRLAQKLYVKINIRRLSGLRGACIWNDDNNRPREFVIDITPRLNYENFLTVLAHELVHVKQYAKGELKDYMMNGFCRWQGKVINAEDVDYYDHPWEIEAYGREKSVMHNYLKECVNA